MTTLGCIGHRGAMGYAPENTLESIDLAVCQGAHIIEVDVHFVHGRLLIIHDNTLDRTTNGTGSIYQHSLSHLRSLDAGNGQKIPLLEEVIDLIDGRAELNIELKGSDTEKGIEAFLRERHSAGLSNDCFLISSFQQDQLTYLRQTDLDIKIGVLIEHDLAEGLNFARQLQAFSVQPSLEIVTQEFINSAHAHKLKVYVYTVNEIEDINRMAAIGVDAVFCDYPDRATGSRLDNRA